MPRVEDLIESNPALGRVLASEPRHRVVLDRLLAAGLARTLTRYLADAPEETLGTFLTEVAGLDLERVTLHREELRKSAMAPLGPEDVEPVPLVTLEDQRSRSTADEGAGLASLEAGHWASVAFAGGAGTRFFSRIDELNTALPRPNERLRRGRFNPVDPKGAFPITPVGGLSFFELIFADALRAGLASGRLPWVLVLTSSVTHERTVSYLEQNPLWGFPQAGWLAFAQHDEPRLDGHGDLVVADAAGHLAWTGDGHGGVYRALLRPEPGGPSPLDRLRESGIEHLVMHNVDNAAARPFSPARLGFHLREGAHFTLSAVRKTDPEEKVGVAMRLRTTGKVEVVEYNVIDPGLAAQRDPLTGRLVHESGNINTNLVALEALRADIEPTLYTGKTIDSRIGPVETSSLEMLNQHLTRALDPTRVRAYEVARDRFFIPTKNVTGPDSVATTVATLSQQHALALETAGAQIGPEVLCDLSPACGSRPEELQAAGIGIGWRLEARSRLFLCAHAGLVDGEPVAAPGLLLEPDSSLLIFSRYPWGDLSLGPRRELRVEATTASRVRLGRGVIVRRGVRVVWRVERGARLVIPDGRVFDRDSEGVVPEGQTLSL